MVSYLLILLDPLLVGVVGPLAVVLPVVEALLHAVLVLLGCDASQGVDALFREFGLKKETGLTFSCHEHE